MTQLAATIVIPTTAGRAPVLPYSIGSVLAQSVADIELFILGDGVDDAARAVIAEVAKGDPRVRFFDNPKHESRGEPYRHAALARARGQIVCYLCDRDLMCAHHVATMRTLLRGKDFGHTLISAITPERTMRFHTTMNLADDTDRQWTAKTWTPENGIPLSFAGHSLDMYRRLPYGWRTTPQGQFTDVYMWQQFLNEPSCRSVSGNLPTVLYFPRYWRKDWSMQERARELDAWSRQFLNNDAELLAFVLEQLAIDRWQRVKAAR